jgi:hypothetical protein
MRHVDGPGGQQFSYHYMVDGEEYDFRHFYTSNVSLRRELLELEPDGFSGDFPAAAFEDAEFAYRLSMHGMRIRYHRAAEAYHHHRYDVRSFFERQCRCGQMAAILYQKHPALQKWLDIDRLEWRRLEVLNRSPRERHELLGVAGELHRWEERVLNLAGFFEEAALSAVDTLLHPLFAYGYRCGLADALFPADGALRVRAAEFLDLLPPAAREFEAQAAGAGHPVPRSDLRAIAGLGLPPK